MTDNQGAYEKNLRHIAEPAAPSERRRATSVDVEDYVGLWYTNALRDFAYYGCEDEDPRSGIAVGLASYIDKKVRDEGRSYVTIYLHTDEALATVRGAVKYAAENMDNPLPLSAAFNAFEDPALAKEMGEEPTVVEIDGEETVVYDEEEARQSYADMKMAEAEAAHERKIAKQRERHFEQERDLRDGANVTTRY